MLNSAVLLLTLLASTFLITEASQIIEARGYHHDKITRLSSEPLVTYPLEWSSCTPFQIFWELTPQRIDRVSFAPSPSGDCDYHITVYADQTCTNRLGYIPNLHKPLPGQPEPDIAITPYAIQNTYSLVLEGDEERIDTWAAEHSVANKGAFKVERGRCAEDRKWSGKKCVKKNDGVHDNGHGYQYPLNIGDRKRTLKAFKS